MVLAVARRHECHFAVLGGGTSPFKGASVADQGITIDLQRMRDVEFADGLDLRISVGGGARWADVYQTLDPKNMSAVGTRNSLTGGISFFSEHHGWACDSAVEFEVVLADSTVIKATQYANADLFWALKGGGNNFGIVTRIVLEVFRDPPRWYTFQLFNLGDLFTVFKRLENHTNTMIPHVWQIATTFGWHDPTQRFVISERMVASEQIELPDHVLRQAPDGTWEKSAVLQTNVYERPILSMAQKMDVMNAEGFYNFFGSVTVSSNAELLLALARVFQNEIDPIRDAKGLQVYIVYNPITVNAMNQMKKRGGNALGLLSENGPLTVVNINLHWSHKADETRMRKFMRQLIHRFRETASEMDMLNPYVFQNHAFEEQDVFSGYGAKNLAQLKDTRQKVDPDAVFQRLQPGFFKLEPKLTTAVEIKSEL
ncbi:Bifunctional solanapyrone synthase [Talaromyces islandicus]|uniref:Bifunctional solanapyrone synthase n=1 Tax=Talaromyces islandicus TaxID=28573 RepID=A0A0U1M637_TALIS|nr:Bifunctional solanapyrone synthase [Talaromyces islandicus]